MSVDLRRAVRALAANERAHAGATNVGLSLADMRDADGAFSVPDKVTLRFVASLAVTLCVAASVIANALALSVTHFSGIPGGRVEGSSPGEVTAGQSLTPMLVPRSSVNAALPYFGVAPALHPGGRWFNSKPLTLQSLRGKVVLLEFWTYSCINSLRTLPHLEAWYDAYHRYGLVIIGVHTPEFGFEHVASNVAAAIKRLGIRYPVVQDNNYATWDAYGNVYWPAEYLIDRSGRIRHFELGEGGYGQTEADIEALLGVHKAAAPVPDLTPREQTTPETYLGYERLDRSRYVGSSIKPNQLTNYRSPSFVPTNAVSYSGFWRIGRWPAVAGVGAALTLHFDADDVYLVLAGRGRINIALAGAPNRTVVVDAARLYTIYNSSTLSDRIVTIRFSGGPPSLRRDVRMNAAARPHRTTQTAGRGARQVSYRLRIDRTRRRGRAPRGSDTPRAPATTSPSSTGVTPAGPLGLTWGQTLQGPRISGTPRSSPFTGSRRTDGALRKRGRSARRVRLSSTPS